METDDARTRVSRLAPLRAMAVPGRWRALVETLRFAVIAPTIISAGLIMQVPLRSMLGYLSAMLRTDSLVRMTARVPEFLVPISHAFGYRDVGTGYMMLYLRLMDPETYALVVDRRNRADQLYYNYETFVVPVLPVLTGVAVVFEALRRFARRRAPRVDSAEARIQRLTSLLVESETRAAAQQTVLERYRQVGQGRQ